MDRGDETRQAVLKLLVSIGAEPSKPISLYEIGVPLVPAGYSQDELVNSLLSLARDKVIELLPNNALRILKPIA